MRALGVTAQEIDIRPAARRCWPISAIRSAAARRSTTSHSKMCRPDYARIICSAWRTTTGRFVCGTGDLSELGLGWCTYGVGDHMSHYNVNASVSKTLIQHLIRFVATSGEVNEADGAGSVHNTGDRDISGTGAGRRERR